MKFATVSKNLGIGLTLMLATTAFAATKASLTLQSPTTINGAQLKAGEYNLEWDGSGPTVEVSIKQGRKVFAKVPAKIVELGSPANNSAAVVNVTGGTRTLAGARFEGKKFALELGGESSDGMQAGSSK